MPLWIKLVAGLTLIAHGAVHFLYLAPEAAESTYPFRLDSSWLIPEPMRRPVALGLMVASLASFSLLALAVWGVPGLSDVWPALAIAAGAISLALLLSFWDARLMIGVAIDVAVIIVALIRPDWTERIGG